MFVICSNISGESSLHTCKKFLRNFKPVRLLIDLYIRNDTSFHIISGLH